MKVTNIMGLPQAIVDAVSVERHNQKGSYSATTLLRSATETLLMERHYDELEIDVSDNVWAVWGTAVHSLFEKQKDSAFKEEKFSVQVSNSKVTGRVDSYDLDSEILVDYKTCSAWKIIYNDFDDWYKQGMIYSWLMKKSGLNVKECQFIALIKDHSKTKAIIDGTYPQSPVFVYKFSVTEEALAEIEKFIISKVQELEENENTPDAELKGCNKDERWGTDPKFALMRNGRKTAIKLFDTKAEAEANKEALKADYIEERKGEDKKCDGGYCLVCKWCPYFQNKNK